MKERFKKALNFIKENKYDLFLIFTIVPLYVFLGPGENNINFYIVLFLFALSNIFNMFSDNLNKKHVSLLMSHIQDWKELAFSYRKNVGDLICELVHPTTTREQQLKFLEEFNRQTKELK